MNKTCWIVTEGIASLQNQARGLAEALALRGNLKVVVAPGLPWKLLPATLWPSAVAWKQMGITPTGAAWPDIAIGAGRKSIAALLAIRRASKGKTFTVYIQDPRTSPDKFDCIIVPVHDRIRGANVLATPGAMHHVTPKKLQEARTHFESLFAPMPRPLFSVLVGGTSKHATVSGETFRDLGLKLAQIAKETGGSIALTPSRRTGKENEAILRDALKDTPAYIWDMASENPYFGMLSHADYVVVTDDSVSMVSEACATGKPVYIHSLVAGKSQKITRFINALIEKGCARLFTGRLEKWDYTPLADTADAAAFVRKLWAKKTPSGEENKNLT
jgi:mitochondrial fission protein ELM1